MILSTLSLTASGAGCPALAPAEPSDADVDDASRDADDDRDDTDAEADMADGDQNVSDADEDLSDADEDLSDADEEAVTRDQTIVYAKPVWVIVRGHDAAIPAPVVSGFGGTTTFDATLPDGLSIVASSGAITGAPETLSTPGTDVTVAADDGDAHAETTITIRVYDGFVVDDVMDAADGDTDDGVCDDGAGRCTLRAAIDQANALAGEQAIVVPDGDYHLEELLPGGRTLGLTSHLVIHGQSTEGTQIDGSSTARVLSVDGAFVELGFLTIANGRTVEATLDEDEQGAGIYVTNSARLLLHRCLIRENSSYGTGGGLFFSGDSDITIVESEFRDNEALYENGGAIDAWEGSLIIERSLFLRNTGQFGSAIHHTSSRPVTITNSTFTGNSSYTGTIASNTWTLSASITLQNVTIAGNTGTEDTAGLYLNESDNQVFISSSILAGNTIDGTPHNCDARFDAIVTSGGFNLLDDLGGSCNEDAFGEDDILGEDPLLDSVPTDRGGPTYVLVPQLTSPAIDGVSVEGDCAELDQIGSNRPLDGDGDSVALCDIGAYEVPPNAE